MKENCWRNAIEEEIYAIEEKKKETHTHAHTHTRELTTLPLGQRTIGVKWVYKIKHTVDGRIKCYNARLVVKGYKKMYGIEYEEVFTSVVRLDMVRMLISFVAHHSWKIYQLDVKLS